MQPVPETAAGGSARPRERLSRAQHLRSPADFDEVRRLGRRAETGAFTLRLRLRSEGPRRLGIIASRKAGPSVSRNYTKRVLRELFRRNADALPPSCDVVAIVRAGFGELPFAEIRARYLRALQQAIKK
ncbi:MAG TPA: ribonuclease P protein component [Opitutales bacterium]|nr:ribonuclease P protein component [Opitutales bacterium]